MTIQILTSLYVFISKYLFSDAFTSVFFLVFLIYLFLIILPDLIQNKIIKLMVHGLILAMMTILLLDKSFLAFLLPIHIIRIFRIFGLSPVITASFLALPLVFVEPKSDYFFCALILWLFYHYLQAIESKYKKQVLDLLSMEKENLWLNRRICQTEQWERDSQYYIKLDERRKISQKLHDEIGHSITASLVQLQAANTMLKEDPVKAENMISGVCEVLSRGMNSIRRDLKTLKPDIEEWSLEKIKNQLNQFEKHSGCQTVLKVQGDVREISHLQWLVIHANLKEALTNVIKHSSADKVFMEIMVLNKLIKVAISDDGQLKRDFVHGMGLAGMEERTREAGATLLIDNSKGFSLTMIFKKEQ